MTKKSLLREVTGFRGEKIVELCLTDFSQSSVPLFRPGFLGDKWPALDFYVELLGLRKDKLFLFAQAKATRRALLPTDTHVLVSADKENIEQLSKIPGPTYLFAIHEPSKRVFVQAVHAQSPIKAISKISVANELTPLKLKDLHAEVKRFWRSKDFKPTNSIFV